MQTDNKASGHSLQWTKALISKPAPHFEGTAVIKGAMRELKITDYRGKYLVFFFYPLAFTFVCPTEILAFNDRIEEFRALNAEVGLPFSRRFLRKTWNPLGIPLESTWNPLGI